MLLFLRPHTSCEDRADLLALLACCATRACAITILRIGKREVLACEREALVQPVPGALREHQAVERLVAFPTPYQLVHRAFQEERTTIMVGSAQHCTPVIIGGKHPVIIAGPRMVEQQAHFSSIARVVQAAGAQILCAGVWMARTSPYQFQGLGSEGLHLLAEAREQTGLPVMAEVMEPEMVETVAHHADILRIGGHNMRNLPLLRAVGRSVLQRPVMLDRGPASTIDEWLLAAESIVAAGNPRVILCECGMGSDDPEIRTALDLSSVPLLHTLTHLPVIVDPGHATGRRELVPTLARASIAAGADGLLLTTHDAPAHALCEGRQVLSSEQLRDIIYDARMLTSVLRSTSSDPWNAT